jgi:hypothetical protein
VGFAALKNVFALAAFYVAAAHKENAPLKHKSNNNKGAILFFLSPRFRSSARRKRRTT